TLFYLHPVVDGPRVLGTLVLQLDFDRLMRVATEGEGLTKTGETVLVQRDGDHAVFVSVPRRSAAELLSPVSERGPGDP
ncbi:hypothetical protein ABTK37_20940, partial [Acinetobacter baumannii]